MCFCVSSSLVFFHRKGQWFVYPRDPCVRFRFSSLTQWLSPPAVWMVKLDRLALMATISFCPCRSCSLNLERQPETTFEEHQQPRFLLWGLWSDLWCEYPCFLPSPLWLELETESCKHKSVDDKGTLPFFRRKTQNKTKKKTLEKINE